MTSSEAIPLLRGLIRELPGLRHRPAYNKDYLAWEKRAVKLLGEGFDLSYLMRFERYKARGPRDLDNFSGYLKDLEKKERLLQEIVAAHRSLIAGVPEASAADGLPVIELSAADLAELGIEPELVQIEVQPVEAGRGLVVLEGGRQPEAGPQAPPEPVAKVQPAERRRLLRAAEARGAEGAGGAAQEVRVEERLREEIRHKELLLEETERALAALRRQLDGVGRLKGLLSAGGEELEALAREALSSLGLEVTGDGQGPGLYLRSEGGLIPLELEAAPAEVPERALRRLIARLPDDAPEGCRARGCLLASAHQEAPAQVRLEAGAVECFGARLAEQAAGFGVCLISAGDLVRALTGQAGEVAPEEAARRLLTTTGPCELAGAAQEVGRTDSQVPAR